MTDELTDANLVARLRLPYSADPPLAKIAADRLEWLAAENDTLRNQRDRATAEVVNYCAGYRTQLATITAERDKLREALDNFIAWTDDNSFYERLTFDEAVQELRNARKEE